MKSNSKGKQSSTNVSDNHQHEIESAHEIIDLVETAIRDAHPECEKLATNFAVDGEKPNTLLYGADYYDLEDKIIEKLRAFLGERNAETIHGNIIDTEICTGD